VTSTDEPLQPPALPLLLLEGRAFAELAALGLSWRNLTRLPRGDGHPVMVVPGFGASDVATLPLRRLLGAIGYSPYGWGFGRNLGMRGAIREGLRARLPALHERHGQKVSLIGWSLGGVFVRELARHGSAHVRSVITLGSPINGHPEANRVDVLFRRLNPEFKHDLAAFERRKAPPPVPSTAIYSKSDGIVNWRCSQEGAGAQAESVEISGSHFGLTVNPQVLRVIADRLVQPEGAWKPFCSPRP
jgi:pimeloyl-ACP methyl ester carboxylesterase